VTSDDKPEVRSVPVDPGADRGSDRGLATLIYATFPDLAVAEAAGARLLDQRLAACINILAPTIAIYRWEGRVQRDNEVVMIAKTRQVLADAAVAAVRVGHPYANPAVLVLPVTGGSPEFLAWIAAEAASV